MNPGAQPVKHAPSVLEHWFGSRQAPHVSWHWSPYLPITHSKYWQIRLKRPYFNNKMLYTVAVIIQTKNWWRSSIAYFRKYVRHVDPVSSYLFYINVLCIQVHIRSSMHRLYWNTGLDADRHHMYLGTGRRIFRSHTLNIQIKSKWPFFQEYELTPKFYFMDC